ncbi:MAG: hypothetical protein ACO37W_11505 [Prochlorotrichaceae cyanobacterium]
MTVQDFFSFLNVHRTLVVILLLCAPWLALGLTIAIPDHKVQPFILNFNLGMAFLSVFLVLGYVLYATNQGGWRKVITEADMLLLLAPFYYAGFSLWITRQRVSLGDLPVFRTIQGIALITASYLGASWLLRKARIIILAYVSTPFLMLICLGFIGLAYLGYLLLTEDRSNPASPKRSPKGSPSPPGNRTTSRTTSVDDIDDELEKLRRNLRK